MSGRIDREYEVSQPCPAIQSAQRPSHRIIGVRNGTGEFNDAIRKDYFPYFTQGKQINIIGLDLYGQDVTKHHLVCDQNHATDHLRDNQAFTVTGSAEVFLIVHYLLDV